MYNTNLNLPQPLAMACRLCGITTGTTQASGVREGAVVQARELAILAVKACRGPS